MKRRWRTILAGVLTAALLIGIALAQKVTTLNLASTPFDGTEIFYVVQKGQSLKTTFMTMAQQVNKLVAGVFGTAPTVVGHVACWANTAASLINDCLLPGITTNLNTSATTITAPAGCNNVYDSEQASQSSLTFSGSFPAQCKITVLNNGTRGIRVTGVAQTSGSISFFWIYPQHVCHFEALASGTLSSDCPKNLDGQVTGLQKFFVDPVGSDTLNDGLGTGANGAFQTIQNAAYQCQRIIKVFGSVCTIQLAQTSYTLTNPVVITGTGQGQWELIDITGDVTDTLGGSQSFTINCPNTGCFSVRDASIVTLTGVTLNNSGTGATAIAASQNAVIDVVSVLFENFVGGTLESITDGGAIGNGNHIWISGNAAVGFSASGAGHLTMPPNLVITQAVTMSSAFAIAFDGAFLGCEGCSALVGGGNVSGTAYLCYNNAHMAIAGGYGTTVPGSYTTSKGYDGCIFDGDRQTGGFKARPTSNQTGISDNVQTQVVTGTVDSNQGFFGASTWTPPQGMVDVQCNANWTDIAASDTFIINVLKNGGALFGYQSGGSQQAFNPTLGVGGHDHASGSDAYTCAVTLNHGSGTHTIGANTYTFFTGSQG